MGANIYRNKKPVLVFLAPALLFMAVYLYYPFLKNILNSFMDIKQLGRPPTYCHMTGSIIVKRAIPSAFQSVNWLLPNTSRIWLIIPLSWRFHLAESALYLDSAFT